MKVGDRIPLSCGHQGRVVWISDDGVTIAVKGSHSSCRTCYKAIGNPTVHLMDT
jgi:preprotein translocase subunit YajC